MTHEEILKHIGINIQRIRAQRGLSQNALSKQTNIAQQNISEYERGNQNVSIKTLARIANVLQTNVSSLLSL